MRQVQFEQCRTRYQTHVGLSYHSQDQTSSVNLAIAFPSIPSPMSRAPPFPTRRRSPSNSSTSYSQPLSAPGGSNSTRPLQIPRPGSRPTTPVDYASNSPSYTRPAVPTGPSRPQRSELRTRAEYTGSERASISSQDRYNRDSISTSRSDVSGSYYRNGLGSASTPVNGPPPRQRPPPLQSPMSDDGSQTTPKTLSSVLTAFQSAGTRRRQTDETDEDYRRERELEIEAEKARQQRIRDRAPGARRDTRGGEIDGLSAISLVAFCSSEPLYSRAGPGPRWLGVCDRSQCNGSYSILRRPALILCRSLTM